MNENKVVEVTEEDGNVTEVVPCDEVSEKKSHVGRNAVLIGLGLGAVGALVWKKTKAKRRKATIKRLEKEGYTIVRPNIYDGVDDSRYDDEEVIEDDDMDESEE